MKEQIKNNLISRLKTAGFVLSLAGWVMLITVPMEFLGFNFSALENFVETSGFKWGLKIFVVIILILLIKGQRAIDNIINKYPWLRFIIKVIFWGGLAGWIIGLSSLFLT